MGPKDSPIAHVFLPENILWQARSSREGHFTMKRVCEACFALFVFRTT